MLILLLGILVLDVRLNKNNFMAAQMLQLLIQTVRQLLSQQHSNPHHKMHSKIVWNLVEKKFALKVMDITLKKAIIVEHIIYVQIQTLKMKKLKSIGVKKTYFLMKPLKIAIGQVKSNANTMLKSFFINFIIFLFEFSINFNKLFLTFL